MFFGTRKMFKFSYYWTSMIPAYIIFIARIFSELQETKLHLSINVLKKIFNIEIKKFGWIMVGLFVLVSIFCVFRLYQLISKTQKKQRATKEIEVNFNEMISQNQTNGASNILRVETNGFYKINPGLISYLLGTVFSSGTLSFVSSNSLIIKVFIFLVVQLLIWLYVMNSSDSVPNIILVLLRMDLVSINDKYWILINRKMMMYQLTGVKTIVPFASTDARNRLYVLQREG